MAKELMGENPKSRQAEGKDKGEKSQITKTVKETKTVPTPEAAAVKGFDTVKQFDRSLKADAPEEARKKNNQSRDSRTNLGRTIASVPVLE